MPTSKEAVLDALLLNPTVRSLLAHVWVEGLSSSSPLFQKAPALTTTELAAAYWLAQKEGEMIKPPDLMSLLPPLSGRHHNEAIE